MRQKKRQLTYEDRARRFLFPNRLKTWLYKEYLSWTWRFDSWLQDLQARLFPMDGFESLALGVVDLDGGPCPTVSGLYLVKKGQPWRYAYTICSTDIISIKATIRRLWWWGWRSPRLGGSDVWPIPNPNTPPYKVLYVAWMVKR